MKKSCNNVRWKDSVVGYEHNGILNTYKLRQSLINNSYKISKYQIFTIYEPKERTIVASRFVDRQFQRALCDAGLYQDITEHFINDNVACQDNKGTDYALKRTKIHLYKFWQRYGKDGYILKCDIRHFFQETRHDVAKAATKKLISDPRAYQAVVQIIDSYAGDVGIGLGSQVSQLVELSVLNDMDHYIKEKLHIKHYLRYMDDFYLIHNDKEYLRFCKKEITQLLDKIGLSLNKKTTILPIKQGLNFLQWKFVLTDTGKVLMLPNKKKIYMERRRLKRLWRLEQSSVLTPSSTYNSYQSWMANIKRGNSYKIGLYMTNFFNNLVKGEK